VTVLARFALDKTGCPTPFFVKGQSCRIWNNFLRAARERVAPEVAHDDIVAVVAAHLVVFPALDDPGI
jgi:RecJ-like exonuclease